MSEVSVKFTAEDAQLWAALQRVMGASQKTGDAIAGAGKQGRAAAAEMDRLAKRLMEINSTPAERYERNVERMRQSIGRAGFTQEHFNRAVEREKEAFDKATAAASAQSPELAKASEEQRRFIERTKELNATPLERYEENVARLTAAIDGVNFTQDDFNRAVEREKIALDKATAAAAAQSPELAKAAAEMDRLVVSVKKLVSTPVQEHEEYVRKLDAALAATKITQEEHAAAVAKSQEQLTAATLATDKNVQANLKLEAELDRVAAKIKSTYQQPWDRFAAEIDKIDEAFAHGKISVEEHAAATKDEVAALEKATLAADRTAQAEEKAAKEMDDFVASVKKLQTKPIDEYEKSVKKLRAAQEAGKLTQQEVTKGIQDASAKYAAARREISASATATSGFQLTLGRVVGMAGGLATMATGWKLIREAIELANTAITKHTELAKGAKSHQVTVAAAQQEALKNLTGLSTKEKQEVLNTDVNRVTEESGIADKAAITTALGATYSVVNDRELAYNATVTAAKQVPATPDKLEGISKGLALVAQAVGTRDTQEVEGYLLEAGGINLISDTEALTQNLAPVIVAGISQLPKQDPKLAARELGAAFGVMANVSADEQGKATGTNLMTLQGKMNAFFKTHAADLEDAEQKKKKGKKLTDKEKETLSLGAIVDPGTFRGRVELFQKNEKARESLLGDEGFGEQKYRDAISQFLTAGTVIAKRFEESIPKVTFNASTATKSEQEIRTGTPDLELMMEVNKQKAIQQRLNSRPEMGIAGLALEDVQLTLDMTVPAGLIDATVAALENQLGKKFAEAQAVNDPIKAFDVQYNRLSMRHAALLQNELGQDASRELRKRNPLGLGDEQIDRLPIPEGERAKLKAVEDAQMRMRLFAKNHPEQFDRRVPPTPQPATVPKSVAGPPLGMPSGPVGLGNRHVRQPGDDGFTTTTSVAPPSPISLSPQEQEDLFTPVPPPSVPPKAREIPRQPLHVALPAAAQQPPVPAAKPNDLGFRASSVSQETNSQSSVWEQVGRELLAAVGTLATVADRLDQGANGLAGAAKNVGDLASHRRPQPMIPNYSGRARREAAQAVG